MSFTEFLNQAWSDHAKNPTAVAERISRGFQLIESAEQIPQMATLVTHVFGEHLGRWADGVSVLNQLKKTQVLTADSESHQAIERSIASLELASGQRSSLSEFTTSDQVRIYALAASALSGQNVAQAQKYLKQALKRADHSDLSRQDPANRALAVTGNNLAIALEEKTMRTPDETKFMILAAQTARQFWEIAGNWLNIERAEYRLAQTYLKAGDRRMALFHANQCLEVSTANNAEALELFFGFEALALAEKANGHTKDFLNAVEQMKVYFEKLSSEDKGWCQSSIDKMKL